MKCLHCKYFKKYNSKDYMGKCKKFGRGIVKSSLGVDGCSDGEKKVIK